MYNKHIYMSFFVPLNTKSDVLNNVVNKQLMDPIDFHSMKMEVDGDKKG